jgi:hypothetical protein
VPLNLASRLRPEESAARPQLIAPSMKRFLVRLLFLLLALNAATLSMAAESLSGIGIGAGNNWWRSWVDLNGDGRADFCFRYDPDGERIRCFFSNDGQFNNTPDIDVGIGRNHQPYQWWFDVDGDGLADLCRGYDYRQPNFVMSCLFTKDRFQAGTSVSIPIFAVRRASGSPYGVDSLVNSSSVFLVDINADQRTDLCFVAVANEAVGAAQTYRLRCQLSNGTSFEPVAAAWTSGLINPGSDQYPRSFTDMNGDGFPDFCRTLDNGTLSCLLGSENGFTAIDLVSPVLDRGYKEGAAFIDFNADGKADYCRITGPANQYQLRCTPSTGVGWDTANERISPVIPNDKVGHGTARWWIDINADGLPDFCRAVGANPDPSAGPDVAVDDVAGTLACRLNKGDGSSADPAGAFYYSDIEIPANFGRGDGGRQWCDSTGSGFPTLCRNSVSRTYSTTQECVDVGSNGEGGAPNLVCSYPVLSETYALITGLGTKDTPQANHPLLTAYTDGLGAETRIGYLQLTSTEVYTRSGITNTARRFVGPPPTSPVVYETRAWMLGSAEAGKGHTLTGNARYFYGDLTNDPWAGTSRGFRERWMFSEGTNTIDHTLFFQGLGPAVDGNGSVENDPREIGMVRTQKRYVIDGGATPLPGSDESGLSQRHRLLNSIRNLALRWRGLIGNDLVGEPSPLLVMQRTENELADTSPANPRYRYIGKSTTRSYDHNGTSQVVLPMATTTTTQDKYGNVTRIEQTKTQSTATGTLTWTTTTVNDYPDDSTPDGQKWRRLGRLKKSTVTSSAPSPSAQLAANARSAGTSANASAVSSSLAAVGQDAPKPMPLPPQLLMPILQLLLED